MKRIIPLLLLAILMISILTNSDLFALVLVVGLSWLWVALAIGGDVNFTSYYEDNNDCNDSYYSDPPCERARKGGSTHASH